MHYQSSYSVPYTATMTLTFRNPNPRAAPKLLSFRTSGLVSGVSSTHSVGVVCKLDSNGTCPELQPPAAAPKAKLRVMPADADSTLLKKYLRQTAVMGQGEANAVPVGVKQSLRDGKYLARIELYTRPATNWVGEMGQAIVQCECALWQK
jgi:hypothetical protein